MNVVSAPLAPLRQAVLELLREPLSATEVAARLGEGRQRVNYHVRALERGGLVELVEERPRRGCIERVMRATADAVVVEPTVVGSVGEQDRFATDTLLENGARLVRDVAAARRAADARGRRLLTFAIEAEVGFEQPSDLERFADALAERLAELAAEFGPGRRRYRVIVGGHPGMSMDKPFRVEVTAGAPRDVVWRALTEPEQIRHWFGWEYEGLDGEIEQIFLKDATAYPPHRLDLGENDIELVELGPNRTLIRVTKPGDLDAAEWQDVYGDIEEGWITFFNQLRHRLERHPDAKRRMVVRTTSLPALPPLPGEPWHESRYQRGAESDGALAIVFRKPDSGEAMLLVTTYDLGDDAFAVAERRWDAWLESLPE